MFFNHVEEAREELREQVYDAMGEKEAKKLEDKSLVKPEIDKEQETEKEKGEREDMDISEPAELLQEKVESTPDYLTETTEEAKGVAASEGLIEAEVVAEKPDKEAPDVEEGKSVSVTDIQEEDSEKGGQEKQEKVVVNIEKPKEASEEQPTVTLEKQAAAVEVEAEPIDSTVVPLDVGGNEPKEQVVASKNDSGKAVPEQLVGQAMPPAEESPELTTEAAKDGSQVSEKPGQEAKVLPKGGTVSGLSAAADQTPEPETNAEGLTERKDGSGLEEVRAELVPNQEETKLSLEESGAAGNGFETKVTQGGTEKSPEDKVKITANEDTEEREEQMKEGEGNRDMQDLQWVEYIMDLTH